MKEIVVLLLLIATLSGIKPFSVREDATMGNVTFIHQFRWPADAALVRVIPDNKWLIFTNAEMDILPRTLNDRFEKCVRIEFRLGVINTIQISPKLPHIILYATHTENVNIQSRKYYQLECFRCTHTKLTRIPENVNQLKNLKHLDLNGNLIQTVQLDQLNGLDNLKTLDLSNNRIKHIYNHESVSLPSLNNLILANNELKHIDVCSWNMPTLSDLSIAHNNLTHVAINHFGGLKQVDIARNPLNCDWKSSLLRDRSDIYIKEELTCDRQREDVFGLDCPLPIGQPII